MRTFLIVGMVMVSLSACTGEDIAAVSAVTTSSTTSTAPVVTSKNLFSNWLLQEPGKTVALDLQGVGFGTQVYVFYLGGGGSCACAMNVAGTQSSGTIILASCIYDDLGAGGADPGCAGLNNPRTYTKTADSLTVCVGSSCGTYH